MGKFLTVDPLTKNYPSWSPYPFAMNRPIDGVDLDGLEWKDSKGNVLGSEAKSLIKVYVFYDKAAFSDQALTEYNKAIEKYGPGSAALSELSSPQQFAQDFGDMEGKPAKVVIDAHGRNQSLFTEKGQITSTGDSKTNKFKTPAKNIQDFPQPCADLSGTELDLNSCHGNDLLAEAHGEQGPLTGTKQTVAQAFSKNFNFQVVRSTQGSVNFFGTIMDYASEILYNFGGGVPHDTYQGKPTPANESWDYLWKKDESNVQAK